VLQTTGYGNIYAGFSYLRRHNMSGITEIKDDNFDEVTSSGIVVVDFYAVWCGPCKIMAPIFEEAQNQYDGKAVFAKINVDENKNTAIKHKIMGIPTLLFFKDGEIVDRVSGVLEKGALYSKIDALL
jgi:thioredoxin 1